MLGITKTSDLVESEGGSTYFHNEFKPDVGVGNCATNYFGRRYQ